MPRRRSDESPSSRALARIGLGVVFAAGLVVVGAAQASADDGPDDDPAGRAGAVETVGQVAGDVGRDAERTVRSVTRSPSHRPQKTDRAERPRAEAAPTRRERPTSRVILHRGTPATSETPSRPRRAEPGATRAPSTTRVEATAAVTRPVVAVTRATSTAVSTATGATTAATTRAAAAVDRATAGSVAPVVDGVTGAVGRVTDVVDRSRERAAEPSDPVPPGIDDLLSDLVPTAVVPATGVPHQRPGPIMELRAGAVPSGSTGSHPVADDDAADAADRGAASGGAERSRTRHSTSSRSGPSDPGPAVAPEQAAFAPVPPTPSGPSAGTGGAAAGFAVAYLDHALPGVLAGSTQEADRADWSLPGSLTADPGSSPD